MKLNFFIEGVPVPKGRPKFARRGNFVNAYTPKKTRDWESEVKNQAFEFRAPELWLGAIKMELVFYMPRPKSLPKKITLHIKKPDLDNLAKAIKDALQDVIYKSDSQVFELNLTKVYTESECGVWVDLKEIG